LDRSQIQLPDVTILAEVGRGTTGVVYRAQHHYINRVVALKVLLLESVDEPQVRVARFLREAQVLGSFMPHANIPAIHAVAEHRGQPFYIREFVDGTNLKERVDGKAMRKSDALQVLAGVEAALARVHQQGLVHRNLQPDNVLVTMDGIAKLIGFGRATAIDAIVKVGTRTAAQEADMQAFRTMRDWVISAIA
jgi:eukaryotic-like serine/threonine-protein kinase